MFKAICEFFARRRRMREFVAAGRETHEIQAYQPAWVDTMPMQPQKRRVRAGTNVNPPPQHAKPPAPPAPPPVRRERPMSLVASESPDTFDTMSALMMANVDANQRQDEPTETFRSGGGGDFGGGGASASWEAPESSSTSSSDSGSSSSSSGSD